MNKKTMELIQVADIIDCLSSEEGIITQEVLQGYKTMLESNYVVNESNSMHMNKLPINMLMRYGKSTTVGSNLAEINTVFPIENIDSLSQAIQSLIQMRGKSFADVAIEVETLNANCNNIEPFYKNAVLVELLAYSIANNIVANIGTYNNALKSNRQAVESVLQSMPWEYVHE